MNHCAEMGTFKEYLNENTHYLERLSNARSESECSGVFSRFLADKLHGQRVCVAGPTHDLFAHTEVSVATQFKDDLGEHDVSVFGTSSGVPEAVFEVKFVKMAGENQRQIQPFCLFVNDILYMALSRTLHPECPDIIRGAVAFVPDTHFHHQRGEVCNPWKGWFGHRRCDAKSSSFEFDEIRICPALAGPNLGRGASLNWPDFRDPSSLQQRHVSLMLTCGTNGKLVGIFRRNSYELVVRFLKYTITIESSAGNTLYTLIC